MRHQIKKKTHPLSILSQSEKFMVVCYRDLDSGEKFNAVGEKLCINCDCYLYGNIVSNQKYGEQFQTAYYERSKMGKSQKGKELGIGISQRKDGLYTGRVTYSLISRSRGFALNYTADRSRSACVENSLLLFRQSNVPTKVMR